MRVKVEFTLDINPDAWAKQFHIDHTEVRDDVRMYSEGLVRDQLRGLGLTQTY